MLTIEDFERIRKEVIDEEAKKRHWFYDYIEEFGEEDALRKLLKSDWSKDKSTALRIFQKYQNNELDK